MTTKLHSDQSAPVLIALDRGDHEIHAAILATGSTTPTQESFAAGSESLHGFLASLRQRFPGTPLHIAFEQPAPGLLHALMDNPDVELYPMNPAQTARFRDVLNSSRKKDDPTEALVILELLKTHREHFPKWVPESDNMRLLRMLVEGRRKTIDDRTQSILALVSLLKNYYPQALELCGDSVSSPIALDFLKRWPTLQSLKKATPECIRSFLYQHNARSEKAIAARLERIENSIPLTNDGPLLEASTLRLQMLLSQIRTLNTHIATYEKRIATVADNEPASTVMRSFPGSGPTMGPRLTAAFGTKKENFPDAASMACLSGIAPVVKRSGKSSSTQRRLARPLFLHQSFLEYADISIRFCPWAHAFFKMKRTQGKSRWEALRALAFKWIRIMHHCWNTNTLYDDDLYTNQLRKKASPLIPFLDAIATQKNATLPCE